VTPYESIAARAFRDSCRHSPAQWLQETFSWSGSVAVHYYSRGLRMNKTPQAASAACRLMMKQCLSHAVSRFLQSCSVSVPVYK